MLDKENFNLKNKKTKKVLLVATIALVVAILLITGSMAYYKRVVEGTKKYVITAGVDGNITLILNETSNDITIDNAIPQKDEEGKTNSAYTFSIKNSIIGDTGYHYTIYLEDNEIEDGATRVGDNFIKYYLTNDSLDNQKEPALLSSLEKDENGRILETGIIQGSSTTYNYALRFWVDYDATIEDVAGKAFSVKLNIIAEELSFVEKLANKVQESTSISLNFELASSATNGRGIYKYTEDGEDIYYWRGKVDEVEGAANHVLFANLCWEMVRTTSTGGVKIIYDGIPVEADGKKTCPNTGIASQLTNKSAFNSSQGSPAYVGYMYGNTVYEYKSKSSSDTVLTTAGILYGYDVEWTGTEYELKAKDGRSLFSSTGTWSTDITSVANGNHYTCFDSDGKCETVSYVYYTYSKYPYYIDLSGGITIEEALEQMYSNEQPSTIKTNIETWFESTDLDEEENLSKLEDVVYCNDRSVADMTTNGWNKDGDASENMFYSSYTRSDNGTPDLNCSSGSRDRFTYKDTVNGNGLLKWPVGLLTADEIILAGGVLGGKNSDYYLYTGENYFAISPYYFYTNNSNVFFISYQGVLGNYYVTNSYGVRPVVSLAAGAEIIGLGTENSPFEVKSQ